MSKPFITERGEEALRIATLFVQRGAIEARLSVADDIVKLRTALAAAQRELAEARELLREVPRLPEIEGLCDVIAAFLAKEKP